MSIPWRYYSASHQSCAFCYSATVKDAGDNDDGWTLLPDEQDDEQVKWVLTACWIAIGAILGNVLRIIMAQIFGDACANPDSVGWLTSTAPLCVTKDGTSSQSQGGIIFADLPSKYVRSYRILFPLSLTMMIMSGELMKR
jgi:hypothetical protein